MAENGSNPDCHLFKSQFATADLKRANVSRALFGDARATPQATMQSENPSIASLRKPACHDRTILYYMN